MIRLQNITHHFNDQVILSGVNLVINQGEIHSLIGKTGAGKTLLLKLISCLIDIQAGSITRSSNKISFVFQQNPFFEWLTIKENLSITLKNHTTDIQEVLEKFNLSEFLDHYPRQLSGGTIQRLNLLRAFLFKAEIILLDEPFSHLDLIQKEELYSFMIELWRISRPTILLVTHDIDESLLLSHRVSFLSKKSRSISDTFPIRDVNDEYVFKVPNARNSEAHLENFSRIYNLLKKDSQ